MLTAVPERVLCWFACSLACLFVVHAGHFKSLPTTVKTHENDSVLLPCYIDTAGTEETGGEPLKIRWYKDGELVADSGGLSDEELFDRINLFPNGSLEVLNVQHPDTGEYLCEVVRKAPWSSVRQTHAIEVLYPPSVEPIPESGFLQVKLGDEVKMSCNVSGVPYPLMAWRYKGDEMQLLDHRQTLQFPASSQQLSGDYECIATNGVGNPASAVINLNIIYVPEVTTERTWVHTSPGLRAQLECSVSADPPAEVRWYKSNIAVPLDARVVALADGQRHTLLIRNVRISDFGIYTCRASNELGQHEQDVQLSGVANPGMFKAYEQKNAELAKTAYTLIWEVDSYSSIIEYNLWFRPYKLGKVPSSPEWTKLTIPAEASSGPLHSKAYTLTGLKERTVYEAMLFSRNRYGWSKPSNVVRFSTQGTEAEEELITQIQIQENVIPVDLAPVPMLSQATNSRNALFVLISLMYMLLIVK